MVEQVKELRANLVKRDEFWRKNSRQVIELVRRKHPEWKDDNVVDEASSMVVAFLKNYLERPMRKLTLEEALVEYTRRELA